MNTPNKLTLLRVVLVPIFIVFLLYTVIPYNYLFALIVFCLASITDFADGYLARKNNQITTFGKFLDPLADKILVISALVCFSSIGVAHPIAVIIIIAREFMVTSIRLVAATGDGTVIAASFTGKVKTVIQMLAIIAPLVLISVVSLFPDTFMGMNQYIPVISSILIWLSAIFTVYSGIEYLIQNKSLVNTMK